MPKNFNIEDLRDKAQRGDVSFEASRWFLQEVRQGNPEISEIIKAGHANEAIAWLKSTSPEGMQTGNATREERIAKAKEHSAQAGIALEELAQERGLADLL